MLFSIVRNVVSVSSLRSQDSWIALWGCSLNVMVIVIVNLVRSCLLITHCHCICLCHCLLLVMSCLPITPIRCLSLLVFSKCRCLCLFVGRVMSPHYSDKMSKRSQISRIVLWGCSPNVIVVVFVIVLFGHVMSPHRSDYMSQGSQVSQSALW